ncbi:uncharacterized protein LOC130500212 [Raphanus sativus]|uniref:Uncharacterized protein LOC130500212 n=1 Tax=Raphanus sativus TaxID=3726 RepID=A0A9W3CHL5_RAPSA|nr:uncharacterized protein LOC130500212 [Raphanus sativus]
MGTVVVDNLPTEQSEETMKELSRLFKDEHKEPMAIHLLPHCILNTVLDHKSVISPKETRKCRSDLGFISFCLLWITPESIPPSVLAVKDDVVCIFRGTIENRAEIAASYHHPIPKKDAVVVLWVYNNLGTKEDETPWIDAVKQFKGGFSFVLYDAKRKSFFVTSGLDGIPCYWGLSQHGTILFSSCLEMASTKCENFCGQIPKGCYYASGKGLRNFETPDVELKPEFVPPPANQ